MTQIINIEPIFQYAGGKRRLIKYIKPLIPNDISIYAESFLGGGAICFDLQPKVAIVNDINPDLINLYEIVKDEPQALLDKFHTHMSNHNKEYYYKTRNIDRNEDFKNLSKLDKAARVLYLLHTNFNGLIRYNKQGYQNEAYGKPKKLSESNFYNLSNYFNSANITFMSGEYKQIINYLDKNSFVYLDPPYLNASHTRYYSNDFKLKEHIELKEFCDELTKRGIRWLLSNSDCEEIRDLYKEYNISQIQIPYMIASKKEFRHIANELLIKNY